VGQRERSACWAGGAPMTSIPVPWRGSVPGTHALVIGVSDYPFADGPHPSALGASCGLRNLTTAARSASDVAAWLLNEYCNPDAPLASLRVLLSPSQGESIHPDIAARLSGPAHATRAAVEAELAQFRSDCRHNPRNVAFVYIAGHGIQLNKRGAVVLLHDFGDPAHLNELQGAIDVVGCHAGMDENGIAQTQVWFCDALDRPGIFGGPCLPDTINLPCLLGVRNSFPHILSAAHTRMPSGAVPCCTRRPIPGSRA